MFLINKKVTNPFLVKHCSTVLVLLVISLTTIMTMDMNMKYPAGTF